MEGFCNGLRRKWRLPLINLDIEALIDIRGQLPSHLGIGIGDVIKRSLSPTHDERQTIMFRVEDDAFQRQLLQQSMKTGLTIFAQQMHERRIERVLQSLVGRHGTPILTAVVLRCEARKAHGNVGQDHLGQQRAFIQHGSKKERLEDTSRRALRLHHVDHGCI